MSEIDWSKAPEGCTHYVVGSTAPYEKRVGDNWWYWSGKRKAWIALSNIGDQRLVEGSHAIIPRPSPAWSGEGLPPAGCMVRVVDDGSLRYGSGEEGPVVAHVEDCAVVRMSYGLGCFAVSVLRPIRTPEQIAADEREAAITEIEELIAGYSYRHCAEQIYKAGYRKQEGK